MEFQFLIGTVLPLTEKEITDAYTVREFQFLIGTVLQAKELTDKDRIIIVSIPYRYGITYA